MMQTTFLLWSQYNQTIPRTHQSIQNHHLSFGSRNNNNKKNNNKMKSGSFEEAISPSGSQEDALLFSGIQTNSPRPKKNLLKKGGHKFVAAIKSLQCSPRVEGETYGKLESRKSDKKKNLLPPPIDPTQQSHSKPVLFIANFDDFESTNQNHYAMETGSVSKSLELEKVLVRLDSRDLESNHNDHSGVGVDDSLEIFTNNTNETDESNPNEQDKKSDVIQDLWNVSDPPLQMEDNDEQPAAPTEVSASAFPLSEWETPPSPEPFLQNALRQHSQDSNDTPRTCNKSLILTPKHQARLSFGTDNAENDDSYPNNNNNNKEDLFGKPPKELFHHSLSLGDSLSPTEDNSPCRSSGTSSEESQTKIHKKDENRHYLPQQQHQQLDMLNLPAMKSRRPQHRNSIEKNLTPTEKTPATTPNRSNNDSGSKSPQSDGSPISSTVSSFVFSTADGNPQKPKSQARRRVVSPESTSPGFFWKTHPKEDPKQQQTPHSSSSSSSSTQHVHILSPSSPAFFWKTHPRVTIKSYHFQQPIVRRVNSRLDTGLRHHIAGVAMS